MFYNELVSGSEDDEYEQIFAELESFEEENLSGMGSHVDDDA